MRRSCLLFLSLVLLVTSLLGQKTKATADSSVEKTIRTLSEQERDGLMRADADALAKIWSDDFVVTNPFNQFVPKQQVLNLVKNGTLAFKSYERNIQYIKVHGDTVVVAGAEVCVWAGKIPLAGQTSNLRFTQVWRKQGGKWQEIARHASIVPPNQPKVKL